MKRAGEMRRLPGLLSEMDAQRVAEAITAAERKTAGEIVAVVALESSTYLYAPFLWAALVALLAPWPLIYLTWISVQWIFGVQLVVFLVLLMALIPRPIRHRLVPPGVKRSRAHRRAVEQFLAQNLHTTEGRTGILIYVSIAERYAEILADTGIESKVQGELADDRRRPHPAYQPAPAGRGLREGDCGLRGAPCRALPAGNSRCQRAPQSPDRARLRPVQCALARHCTSAHRFRLLAQKAPC